MAEHPREENQGAERALRASYALAPEGVFNSRQGGDKRLRVIGYARRSTPNQPSSLSRQREDIKRYCRTRNLHLVDSFYETKSGALPPMTEPGQRRTKVRIGLGRVLALVNSGFCDGVVVESRDRLSREGMPNGMVTEQACKRLFIVEPPNTRIVCAVLRALARLPGFCPECREILGPCGSCDECREGIQ